MTDCQNTVILELERTRQLVIEASSIDELHKAVDQSMRQALASCRKNSATLTVDGTYHETSHDGLIETLANICITLLDNHDIPRERLINLLDTALAQRTVASPYPTH
jgi:hypothetical protein